MKVDAALPLAFRVLMGGPSLVRSRVCDYLQVLHVSLIFPVGPLPIPAAGCRFRTEDGFLMSFHKG